MFSEEKGNFFVLEMYFFLNNSLFFLSTVVILPRLRRETA